MLRLGLPVDEGTMAQGPFLDPTARHVEIVPFGSVDGVAVSVAAANLQAVMGLPADVLPARSLPHFALIPSRRQYDALPILRVLEREASDRAVRLGVMDGDLCLPIFSYVLGEAQVKGRAAVVSTHRLRVNEDGTAAAPALFYERMAKVALHETAHVLGLTHCREPRCLMRFSLGVEHMDLLSLRFCPECELRLVMARKAGPDQGPVPGPLRS
jgi:archaemetzincin